MHHDPQDGRLPAAARRSHAAGVGQRRGQDETHGRAQALRPLLAIAAFALLAACAAEPERADPWPTAATIAPPRADPRNPATPVKVELGRRLFYDGDLSWTGTMSCATCHEQKRGFTDPNRTRPGVFDDPGERNIQTLANVAWFSSLTWGGPQVDTLEHQALIPIEGINPVEMGMGGNRSDVLPERLGASACYRKLFAAAFPERGGRIDMDTITFALAAFQRDLVSLDAPYDRYRRGERDAISAQAKRGAKLFEQKQCASCHAGVHFTDAALPGRKPAEAFHALAPPAPGETLKPDTGLHRITQREEDVYRFRTPGLRNVALSAPYMHNGELPTLAAAIRHHYTAADRQADERLKQKLSDREVADIVAFLGSLTDEGFITNPAFALPKPECPIP